MGSGLCCGRGSSSTIMKKQQGSSMTANRRQQRDLSRHGHSQNAAYHRPVQNIEDRNMRNRGVNNVNNAIGRSPIIPRMMLNDPHMQQIIARLLSDGKSESDCEHIDIYDDEAMKKLDGLQLPENGLAPNQIDSIIPYEYSRKIRSSTVECNICLVDFKDGDMVKFLQCLHTYHQKCIDEWLAKKCVCPDCKFNLRVLDIEQLI